MCATSPTSLLGKIMIEIFLLPWTIFTIMFKFVVSGSVWALLFYGIYYLITSREYTYKFRSPITRTEIED